MLLGLMDVEKYDLESYHLKDVAQSWYKVWPDSRALGGVPITWDILDEVKMTYVGMFVTLER